jgi:hypothetical protein
MALTALIVSVLALLVSTASAAYARRQALAQDEATAIERDRRHNERAPDFETQIEDVNNNFAFFRLWVALTSNEPLDSIAVELPADCSFHFADNVSGVLDPRHAESYQGPIGPGERVCWRVVLPDTAKEEESFLISSTSGTARWTKRIAVSLPSTNLGIF